jgi:Tfp pilus assembly protein FimT
MNIYAPGRSREAGFSIAEMLVVLLGAGIIAAMAVPNLVEMMNSYNTAFSAQEIRTNLHAAKLKAISINEPIRVNFPGGNTYRVELSDGALLRGPFNLPHGIRLNSDGGSAVTFPGNYVTFQPDGTVPASGSGSSGRVRLISNNGLRVEVLVDRGGMISQTPVCR